MAADNKIWIGQNGEKFGPYSEANIRQWLADGKVSADALGWCTGMPGWISLATMFPASVTDLPPPPPPINSSKPAADYGIFLLAIPAVATLLIWVWVSGMNLLQSPQSTMSLIMLGTILGTAIVAAMEASKVGMKSDRSKGTYSPTAWFFILMLIWIVGYPIYLYKRKYYGLANRLTAGILVALIFVISYVIMNASIAKTRSELFSGMSIDQTSGVTSAYQDYLIRSQVSEGAVLADGAKTAMAEFYSNTGHFPPNNASAGLAESTLIAGKYVSSVDVSGGRITVAFDTADANSDIRDKFFVLVPVTSGGSVSWDCTQSTVQDKYLPTSCSK